MESPRAGAKVHPCRIPPLSVLTWVSPPPDLGTWPSHADATLPPPGMDLLRTVGGFVEAYACQPSRRLRDLRESGTLAGVAAV